MKGIDVIVGMTNPSGIRLYDADTQDFIIETSVGEVNNTCFITAVPPSGADEFNDYFIITVANYSGRRLFGFWNYGPAKLVLDIPEDTGSGRLFETFDYSNMIMFANFSFKKVKLKHGVSFYTDPAYPNVNLNGNDVKIVPITPNVISALGSILEEV